MINIILDYFILIGSVVVWFRPTNQYNQSMKKSLLTILALSATAAVAAQSNQAPAANAILVSQTRQGDVVTTRYKIPHDAGRSAEFDMHYAINKSNIVPAYSDNSNQIAELKDFMAQCCDSTMHVSAIHIVGYASPDGDTKHNDTLASQRAQSLYHYAVNTYHPAQKISTSYKALRWSDCVPAVENSNIPNKSDVLSILKSTAHTEPQKEIALRRMPEAWNYLASNILPQMRHADIEFDYGVDEFVTRTTVLPQTKPAASEQATQPAQTEPVVVEEEMGIIIATPNHDNNDDKHKHRKDKKDEKGRVIGEYEAIYW